MFPTFTPFTSEHPRFTAIFGFCVFVLGTTLWLMTYQFSQTTPVTQEFVEEYKSESRSMSDEERLIILESLKGGSAVDVSDEEKNQILEELSAEGEDTISDEEKIKVLDELR